MDSVGAKSVPLFLLLHFFSLASFAYINCIRHIVDVPSVLKKPFAKHGISILGERKGPKKKKAKIRATQSGGGVELAKRAGRPSTPTAMPQHRPKPARTSCHTVS